MSVRLILWSDWNELVACAVKPSGVVVGDADAGQWRQHRTVVPALSRTARPTYRQHGTDAAALRSLRIRLRLPLSAAARGCAAHLLVRHLAIERAGRPFRGDRRRGLLHRAM